MKEKYTCDIDAIHTDLVDHLSKSLPKNETLDSLSEFFKIFSDKSRLKILWLLDKNELCVCDIAHLLNMTKSAVSHQLKTLRLANLVRTRRQGKEVYYKLSDNHIAQIFETALCHILEC
ncbi:MAG: winged helix-turn-helix transcriptional regulator [Clostridia bacterium]|nr:winged helix-turn-helix transcriptional regulator [Clostridia bacterium]